MGRYYSGDIGGKFWFAIQDSCDAEYFGNEPEEIYVFHDCSCHVHSDDLDNDKVFCENCFQSYEEHMNVSEDTKTWHVSESETRFRFEEEDIDKVQQKINELEQLVGKYMDSYKIQDREEIEYTYTLPSDVHKNDLPLIARLCLGRQIAFCLEKRGVCTFYAEL